MEFTYDRFDDNVDDNVGAKNDHLSITLRSARADIHSRMTALTDEQRQDIRDELSVALKRCDAILFGRYERSQTRHE